jgi:hypothetical protein
LDQLSTTDITRHTTGKLSMLVATVSKLEQEKPYVPFIPFPSWYGKYSKREKHRKYLAQLHARKHDLETIPLLRSKLMELANELSEKPYPEIAKAILKAMQKEHITYDLLFDAYEDCCYEGSELEEFDTPLQKELKKQAQAFEE